jgi:hypothetical protein
MPEIEMTILRLSKQVFQECKGIFCARNVVGFEEARDVLSLKRIHQGLSKNIQHLMLPFEIVGTSSPGLEYLKFLRDWSRTGNLKSLTLISSYSSSRTAIDILLLNQNPLGPDGRFSYNHPWYLDVLQHAFREGYFSHLERNIAVYSGHRKATRVLGQHDKASPLERDFLKDLGDVFGANVWRDDMLCFKNGVEVKGAFAADPVTKTEPPGKYEEFDTGGALEPGGDLSQSFAP